MRRVIIPCLCVMLSAVTEAQPPAKKSAREALAPFNDLVGDWRSVGEWRAPAKDKDFWNERMSWVWKFKGDDAWLTVEFKDSHNFTSGELRYDPAKDHFTLTVKTPAKETLTFAGEFKDKVLTLDREDKKETHRLVMRLLHHNRVLYRYEVKAEGKSLFAQRYKVAATKEGVPFAAGDGRPECIVTGGLGTISVSYQGNTYYVCCSGCRDAFRENPEKYIKEYEAKKAKKK